jgi:hypothetical protein
MNKIVFSLAAGVCFTGVCLAQDTEPDNFRFEITSSYWLPWTRGSIQSGPNSVDLRTDLGIEQNRVLFDGRLVIKPGRKHRIVVEGVPYRLRGIQDLTRDFTYKGGLFPASERVSSQVDLTYIFAGYQYDFVSRASGHFGGQIGGAYLHGEAFLQGLYTGQTASQSRSIGLPLLGLEFERYLLPPKRIDISGDFKGMSAGSYGHYVGGSLNVGVRLLRGLTAEAGYSIVNLDSHTQSSNPTGAAVTFTGPIFSLRFRDR